MKEVVKYFVFVEEKFWNNKRRLVRIIRSRKEMKEIRRMLRRVKDRRLYKVYVMREGVKYWWCEK